MSLYIIVSKKRGSKIEELASADFGPYGLLHAVKSTVAHLIENDKWGTRFPLFMNRSDTDARYTSEEVLNLVSELEQIEQGLRRYNASHVVWAKNPAYAKPLGYMVNSQAANLAEYFEIVGGETALGALKRLCRVAIEQKADIIFT